MSALTQDRQMIAMGEEAIAPLIFQPVAANAVIYAGGLVALDDGYLVEASSATGLVAAGIAQAAYDNTGGSDGAVSLQIRQGTFAFFSGTSADAITQANVGDLVYIIDDQTVGLTSGGGTRSIAGTVIQLMSQTFPIAQGGGSTTVNYVFVEVGLSSSALASVAPGRLSAANFHAATVVVTAAVSSVVFAGAKVGDVVLSATDLTAPGNVAAAYESTISIAGHIQQTAATGSDGVTTADVVSILLLAQS